MPMNIQTAILPHKHVRFSESLIAIAGLLRQRLSEPRTLDELWATVESEGNGWPSKPSFTQVVLAVDVLFSIGQIRNAPGGRVQAQPSRLPASNPN
ncbi:ABC-three component system middle component 6 [Terriglobus sp.]|uniref:ABC-three component system middle component 6 n=1 Tax=Terriglobus sp. TaxID=1889013 RepID=UPI003AFF700D